MHSDVETYKRFKEQSVEEEKQRNAVEAAALEESRLMQAQLEEQEREFLDGEARELSSEDEDEEWESSLIVEKELPANAELEHNEDVNADELPNQIGAETLDDQEIEPIVLGDVSEFDYHEYNEEDI